MTSYQFKIILGFLLLFTGGFSLTLTQLWVLYQNQLTFRDTVLEIKEKQKELVTKLSQINHTSERGCGYSNSSYHKIYELLDLAIENKKYNKKSRRLLLERLDILNNNSKRDTEL